MAVSMVVAVGGAAEPLIDAIKERIPKIKVGAGDEPGVEMGPLITREHRDRVVSYIERAPSEGAKVVVDGREGVNGEGFFVKPTLSTRRSPACRSTTTRSSGRCSASRASTRTTRRSALVNENPFGNGTAIFTRDGGVARQFQFDAQVGMVGVNVPIPVPVAYYSFGGWKNSLFGDLHIYGPEGIQFYTRGKVVTSRWPDPATSKVDLGFPQTH